MLNHNSSRKPTLAQLIKISMDTVSIEREIAGINSVVEMSEQAYEKD